jgi:hypothetical protein
MANGMDREQAGVCWVVRRARRAGLGRPALQRSFDAQDKAVQDLVLPRDSHMDPAGRHGMRGSNIRR